MRWVLSVLCVALVFGVMADDGYSSEYSSCIGKTEGVTIEIQNCTSEETAKQDARLNRAYKAVIATLNPDRAKEMKEVQNSWLIYRNLVCKFYKDPDGRTSAAINLTGCFLGMTKDRAKDLEDFLSKPADENIKTPTPVATNYPPATVDLAKITNKIHQVSRAYGNGAIAKLDIKNKCRDKVKNAGDEVKAKTCIVYALTRGLY